MSRHARAPIWAHTYIGLVLIAAAPSSQADPLKSGTVAATAYLREGPGVAYRPIDEAQTGQEVVVRGCEAGWCQVTIGALGGYLPERALAGEAPAAQEEPQACFVNREAGHGAGRELAFCTAAGSRR